MIPEVNKVYQGDAIEILGHWNENVVDHCIADPPYNLSTRKGLAHNMSNYITVEEEWDKMNRDEYKKFTSCWLSLVSQVVKPNGNIFIFGSYHNIYTVGYIAQEYDMKIVNHIVWYKPNPTPSITCRMLTFSYEHLLWICNNTNEKATGWMFDYITAKAINKGCPMHDLWTINAITSYEKEQAGTSHPTQKPEKLISRIINIATNPNDIVLDLFAGSGTTAAMCKRHDRNFVAIEKEPKYVDMIHERLAIIDEDNKQLELLEKSYVI